MKNLQIHIRVSQSEKILIEEKAKELNMNTAQFLLHATTNHSTQILQSGRQVLKELKELREEINKKVALSIEEEKELEKKIQRIIKKKEV